MEDDSRKGTKHSEINRRFTQMDTERNPLKNITAEAQRAQRAQRINFLFVGRRRQTKNIPQIRAKSFCLIVVSRLGKRDFLSVLCGREKKFKNHQNRKICPNEIKYLQLLILAKRDFFSRPASLR